jgi:hypothetical protein
MISCVTAPAARRLVAAAAAFALVAASVVSLAHRVEERHEVCAEHGELIHVGNGWVEATPADALVESDAGTEHGEHCLLASVVQSTLEIEGASLAMVPPPDALEIAPAAVAVARGALYRLAPKNSPPV